MEFAPPRLEKRDQNVQIVHAAQARASIITASRMLPMGITLFKAVGERDHISAPLGAADGAKAEVGRETNVVKSHDLPQRLRWPRARARMA